MNLKSLEISPWIAWLRKIRVLSTVTRSRRGGTLTTDDFLTRVRYLQEQIGSAGSIHNTVRVLWQIEGLAYRYFQGNENPLCLKGTLATEAGPPAHCGLGMASVVNYGFDASALYHFIEKSGDPEFLRAAYESVGVMLAACERDFFGRVTGLLGRLKLLRRPALTAPTHEEFLQKFDEDTGEFISHGYGRLLYFKCHRLSSAVARARKIQFLPTPACIHGIVGAYILVNSSDLERALLISQTDEDPMVTETILAGLFNTLLLLEWSLPGCLAGLRVSSPNVLQLMERATEFAHWAKEEGRGPLFVA